MAADPIHPATGAPFNFAAHLLGRNADRGDKIAYMDDDGTLAYAELDTRIRRLAAALTGLGIHREERVLLLMHDTPEFVYAFFGAIKIGAVPVPLNTLWKPADYDFVVRDARPSAIVVERGLADRLDARQPVVYVENLLAGGGEELGGLRALGFYHRRSAVQASLDVLARL